LVLLLITYIQALWVTPNVGGLTSLMFLQLATVYLVLSVSESDLIRRVAGVAVLCSAALFVGTLVWGPESDSDNFLLGLAIVNVLLYAAAPVLILRYVFIRRVVDLQTFLGAVCAYLMIGMLFAFTYQVLAFVSDRPFFTNPSASGLGDYLFFSFVTITTIGYGNLVPAGEIGQTLAVWEAILGQFFLAAVVAKIVSSWRPYPHPQTTSGSTTDEAPAATSSDAEDKQESP
jgi:hypothetical protein